MRYRGAVGTIVRRSFAVSALASAATALGLVFALGASAAANHHRLGVFSHPLHRKHHGHASAQKPPAGAVLAEMFRGAEVYVSEGGGLICLTVIDTASSEGSSCGRASEVLREGMLTVHVDSAGVRVGVLVPNGVSSVTLVDHGGGSHGVTVTNNVAESYDSNVASVRYKLANGSVHSESIPAEVVKPRPPR